MNITNTIMIILGFGCLSYLTYLFFIEDLKKKVVDKFKGKDNRSRVIPTSVKEEVLKRQSYECATCSYPRTGNGNYNNLQFHHKIPFAQGGENTADNICALCPNCHFLLTRSANKRNDKVAHPTKEYY